MIVKRMGRKSIESVHEILAAERNARVLSPHRSSFPNLALLYEPEECFSMTKELDREFIKDRQRFDEYRRLNHISFPRIPRGGGIMWHGPGQLNLAAVVDLRAQKIDFDEYKDYLEQTCLRTIRAFGIEGILHHYQGGSQGVWARDPIDTTLKKIAFFGFSFSRGIAIHGCAVNVRPDLTGFSLIYPCNLKGVEAISMERLLGPHTPTLEKVEEALKKEFEIIIEREHLEKLKKSYKD